MYFLECFHELCCKKCNLYVNNFGVDQGEQKEGERAFFFNSVSFYKYLIYQQQKLYGYLNINVERHSAVLKMGKIVQ